MRILIASPFKHPSEGVLGLYARGLSDALQKQGHRTEVASLGHFERKLPSGLRHLVYGVKIIPGVLSSDVVLALDPWSVGFPALLLSRVFGKRFSIRIGGDFLWESYVARTKEPILLSEFYKADRAFSLKEKLISRGMRYLISHADALFFTTQFQRELWRNVYVFESGKAHIVENYFPPKTIPNTPRGRTFVSAGRNIFLKNTQALRSVFERITKEHPEVTLETGTLPHDEHLKRVDRAYAVIIPTLSEICSNTAIEAVAHGKPFIMSRDTGTSERLEGCGLFIDTRSKEEILRAIERILDGAVYQQLQERIKALNFTHSWENIAEEMASVFSLRE